MTSSVKISGVQQGFVAQPVDSRSQSTFSGVDGEVHALSWRAVSAQAQLQPFLDQASQARAPLKSHYFGVGQQRFEGGTLQVFNKVAPQPRRSH